MPGSAKVNGTWRNLASASAKVNGSWKDVAEAYAKVNGVWQQWLVGVDPGVAGYETRYNSGLFHKITFATDVWTASVSNFGTQAYTNGAGEQAGVKGVVNPNGNDLKAVAFPSDTVSNLPNLTNSASFNTAYSNDGVAVYITRGNNNAGNMKYTVSTNSVSNVGSNPGGFGGEWQAGFENQGTAGYHTRGKNTTNMYKMSYSTDTVSETSSAGTGLDNGHGLSNYQVAGYVCVGNDSNNVRKYTFPTDTVSNFNLNGFVDDNVGFQSAAVAGYFTEGSYNNKVMKFPFATDTAAYTSDAPSAEEFNFGFQNGV